MRGPQSARPLPRANETASRSPPSSARNEFPCFLSGTKDSVCWGSSASSVMSYSLFASYTSCVKQKAREDLPQLAVRRQDQQSRSTLTPRMPVNLGDWCRRLSGMVVLPYLEGPTPLSAGSRNTIRRRLLALDRCGDELVVACPRKNNHGHLESPCYS